MKKILFLLLLCFPVFSNAQFLLTPKGFISSEDQTKDFVVYNFEGKSQKELFTKVLSFATSTYNSPKDVISKVENEMITLTGFQPDKIGFGGIIKMTYDLNYTLVIKIKDGKIRLDAPTFDCKSFNGDKINRLTLDESNGGLGSEVKVGIFKKTGKVSRDAAKEGLEKFFNALAENIKASIISKSGDAW